MTVSDNIFSPAGPFTQATASRFLEEGKSRAAKSDLLIDFSAVTEADSSVLAVLFACMREAQRTGHIISVHALPKGVQSLAKLYGIDTLLPIAD